MAGVLPSFADISFVDESALQDVFISELERVGFIAIAEQRLGLKGFYRKWVESDGGDKFAARAYDAERAFNGVIVAEMIRRGIHGVPRLKFYKGDPIQVFNHDSGSYDKYIEHEYSDGLLQSLAQARMPEFRTSRQEVEHSGAMGVEHSGSIGGTIKHAIYNDPEYIDYIEAKQLEERGNPATVGSNSTRPEVFDAESSEVAQQGGDGDDQG